MNKISDNSDNSDNSDIDVIILKVFINFRLY